MVVAGERLVQREVLLDDLGAEKVCRREGLHRDIGRDMVRIADLEVGERAFQRLDDAEVGVVGAGGIAEHAVQDCDVLAARALEGTNRLVRLGEVARANADDDRLTLGADMLDEGQIRRIGGRDLVEIDVLLQVVCTGVVERSRGEVHAPRMGVLAELGELRLPEGVVLFEEVVLRLGRLLGEVPVGGRILGDDGTRLVGLELSAVAARLGRTVDVALGCLERGNPLGLGGVVEVDTHLGNQIRSYGPHFLKPLSIGC